MPGLLPHDFVSELAAGTVLTRKDDGEWQMSFFRIARYIPPRKREVH